MGDPEWMTIGELGRRSGLTVKALRHYDRVGVLRPVSVDSRTGYRRYAPDQVVDAVCLRRLREIDLPLAEVAQLLALRRLGSSDPAGLGDALHEHRRRLEARLTRVQRELHRLNHLVEEGMHTMDQMADRDVNLRWGKELFNRVWTLLEIDQRTADEDAEMVHAAHASCFHWRSVGEPVNFARGEWQCSRVYATLGRAEPALYHARRSLAICTDNKIGDFDLAFAYEALARAHAVAGDGTESARWADLARVACEDVEDDDDRELVLTDLSTLPNPPPVAE